MSAWNEVYGLVPVPKEGPGLKICPIKKGHSMGLDRPDSGISLLCDTDRCAWWDEKRQECGRKRR